MTGVSNCLPPFPRNQPLKPQNQILRSQRKSKKNRSKHLSEDDAADKTAGDLKKDNNLAPAVGCPAKVKINGFEMMAINLQNKFPSKINLTVTCQTSGLRFEPNAAQKHALFDQKSTYPFRHEKLIQ
ncbi:hypothetical protein VP01_4667g4 [Puccinia sorghi]|uniref:Uncharacterized protein n=1 Tax=Puccinia sorghi TaxID=27349 RepID=A0A0L6UQ55_9BASI|nr:hypothetical protein VP01_4667g4 [Puccinia sorghi]